MRIEPIKASIGARIHVARDRLTDPDIVHACLDALEQHGVLVFPRISLDDAEQLAFTERLGHRGVASRRFPGAQALEGEVFEIALDAGDKSRSEYVKVSFFWHIDGLVADAPIPKAALLSARRVATRGGQTEFVNTFAAYEALPQEEKDEIADLVAVHTAVAGFRQVVETPTDEDRARWATHAIEREHPLVWTHADDRKSLMVSITADHVVGMGVPEGRALLIRLTEWAAQPAFKYRHEWAEGDLVIWNNHGVLHRVIPYDVSSGRSMHRTSIDGAIQSTEAQAA